MFVLIILWFFSFIGLGKIALQFFTETGISRSEQEKIAVYALVGGILVTEFSILLNFWIPVSAWISAAILGTGIIGFMLRAKSLVPAIGFKNLFLLLIAAIFLNHLAAGTQLFPLDTAIYHLQSIRWIRESPAVLGLANLEGKLGFNSVWFSLAAAMSTFGTASKGAFLINAVLLIIYICLLQSTYSNDKKNGFVPLSAWFITATVFLAVSEFILNRQAVYPATDAPGMLLFFIITFYTLKACEEKKFTEHLAFIFLLALWTFTLKMSALICFLATMMTLFYFCFKKPALIRTRNTQVFILFSLILGVLWSLKGLASSGCLFFPNSLGCLSHLKWQVPEYVLQGEIEVIRSWAKKPYFVAGEQALHNWQWFKPWLKEAWKNLSFRYCCGILVIGLVLSLKKPAGDKKMSTAVRTLSLISLAGIIFWFMNAPDPRFGLGYLGTLGCLIFSFNAHQIMKGYSLQTQKKCIIIFLTLSVLPSLSMIQVQKLNQWQWPQIKTASYHQEKNMYGVEVNIPDENMLCWDTPIPCAPFLRKELKMIKKNTESRLPAIYYYDHDIHQDGIKYH